MPSYPSPDYSGSFGPQFTPGEAGPGWHQPSDRDKDVEDGQHPGPLVPHKEVAQNGGRDGGVAGRAGAHDSPGQEEQPGILGRQAQDPSEPQDHPRGEGPERVSEAPGPGDRSPPPPPGVEEGIWAHRRLATRPAQVPTSHGCPLLAPAATASPPTLPRPGEPFFWAVPLPDRHGPPDSGCHLHPPPTGSSGRCRRGSLPLTESKGVLSPPWMAPLQPAWSPPMF